ncbi:MAG: IS1595 family transposase [Rhizobiaceae bacterium]
MKLTDAIYTDEHKAREHLEKLHWPHGPICPHCGNSAQDRITKLQGQSTRPGVYKCKECRKPFSVTVGTLMERSHIKINVWLAAMHLLTASKKGMSAHQMHRMLGISYESAWFLCHRLREAMREDTPKGGLGGQNKVVEADEAYVGGKAKNRAHREPAPKKAVLSLVEREGRVASFHVANVTADTVRPIIVTTASRASALMTDESVIYPKLGREFASHGTVNHSANEYARLGGFMHVNTAENFFSILKRGITGVYHSVSEAHLHRYLAEFDYRYNNRTGLGVSDKDRAEKAIKNMVGKRLTYRRTDEARYA